MVLFQGQALALAAAKPRCVHGQHVQLVTKLQSCSWGPASPTAQPRSGKHILKSTGVENGSAFLELLSTWIRPVENLLFPQATHFYKPGFFSFFSLNIDVISYHLEMAYLKVLPVRLY